MTVKGNQPTLLADLETLFNHPTIRPNDLRQVQHTSKARGRVEKRILYASTDLNAYLDWPSVGQVFCLERHVLRLKTKHSSLERVFGITSLTPDQLDLAKVLQRWRDHWSIENRLHWVKDTLFGEDACRVRSHHAPHTFACLRNTVISIIHLNGFQSVKAAREHFALHLPHALAVVGFSRE